MKTVRSALIVDDNPDDVDIATYFLEDSGRFKHVLTASDGQEALNLFVAYQESRRRFPDAFPPIVIFVDINMPNMNGFEFLDAFQKLKSSEGVSEEPVFVMLTSSQAKVDRDRAHAHQLVVDYIAKPIDGVTAESIADRFGVTAVGSA